MTLASPASPSPELAPRLHVKAPSHLTHILEEFDEGVLVDAPNTALRAMRQAFALLLGLSTDLVAAACVELGASADLFILAEGDPVRLAEAEGRLKEGLYFLSQRPDSALGKALTGIFFDEAGSPRQFYLLTQGGKVEGMMGGLLRISDFCKEPRRAPGRSESFKLRNLYLPHLEAWLQGFSRVWDETEVVWERTDLRGRQRLLYRLLGSEVEVGQRIELHGCKACIPSRVLRAPEGWVTGEPYLGVPQEVPEHTLHLVDRFSKALEDKDVIESTRLLRDTLEFLLRYFAGVGKTLCETLHCLNDEARKAARNTESVDNCERLLQNTVDSLKSHQDDLAAKELVGVFYRRDANLDLQPRSHTNILLLEGVLSSWFKQERGRQPSEERYAKDFERYFPLFRDWVRSMGPYFSHTEHFAETPTPQGQLPLTTRCGEHLLELTDNNYLLRIRQCPVCLPNPEWTQVPQEPRPVTEKLSAEQLLRRANTREVETPAAAIVEAAPEPEVQKTFPGEFRPITLPPDAPKFLGRILRRLDVRLRRGELPDSSAALRDALDYLLRYWAGVCCACARTAKKLTEEEQKLAASSLSAHECEKLLNSTLKMLSVGVNELSEEIVQVFYHRDLFTDEMKPLGGHTRMLMTDISSDNQMQLLAEFCDRREMPEMHQARRDLKMFLPVLRDWLDKSQAFFDQCQHHEEEPDNDGRMELVVQWDKDYLELVAPEYSFYVRPGADDVPDLPVPEYFEPAPEMQTVDSAPKPKIITTEELAMQEPFLTHKVQYVGMQPNSERRQCKSGIISIQNAGGGSLTGRAYSNHPCIEVSPNRFRDKTQLTYWLDEGSIPRDFVPVLVLRSGGDERQVTLAELRPLSRFSTMSGSEALIAIYAGPVAGFIAVNLVLIRTHAAVAETLKVMDSTEKLKLDRPDLHQTVLADAHLVGGLLLLYAAAAPLIAAAAFKRLSHSLQDLQYKHLGRSLRLPSLLLFLLTVTASVALPFTRHPEIKAMNLLTLLPWAVAFNVYGAGYAYLEFHGKFAEWIADPGLRRIIPLSAVAFFLILWTLALI